MNRLKSSDVVKNVIVKEIIVLPRNEKLIAEAVLLDSSKLYIRERYRKPLLTSMPTSLLWKRE